MWRFFRSEPKNPAIAALNRHRRQFDAQMPQSITLLPRLSQVFSEGRDYLYDRGIHEVLCEYDARAGSQIAAQIDDAQKAALSDEIVAVMLYAFHRLCSARYPGTPAFSAHLTDALHFEMYRRLPAADAGVSAYLAYHNPHFEDPKVAYAFRFGQRGGAILATLDTPFLLMLAQRAPLIVETAEKLTRFVLFNEPIVASSSPNRSEDRSDTHLNLPEGTP